MDMIVDADCCFEVADKVVELKVGPTEQSCFAHAGLLRKNSSFFDAAFKKEWDHDQSRVVRLPEDDSDAVRTYVHWLYTGKFALCKVNPEDHGYQQLAKLYVLGEKILDVNLQDGVINAIVAVLRNTSICPGDGVTTIIYEGTPRESPARRLIVDLYRAYGHGPWVTREQDSSGIWDVPAEFKDELVEKLLATQRDEWSAAADYEAATSGVPCAYHKHDKDKPCSRK